MLMDNFYSREVSTKLKKFTAGNVQTHPVLALFDRIHATFIIFKNLKKKNNSSIAEKTSYTTIKVCENNNMNEWVKEFNISSRYLFTKEINISSNVSRNT